jgi:hypothetical protein
MRYSRALPREGLPLRHIGQGAGNVHRACIVASTPTLRRASWDRGRDSTAADAAQPYDSSCELNTNSCHHATQSRRSRFQQGRARVGRRGFSQTLTLTIVSDATTSC